MISLPETVLSPGSLEALADCIDALGAGRTVVVGSQRTEAGDALDEFVVAAALGAARPGASVGVAARVGEGRAASVLAREATCAQLLGACDAVVLTGAPAACVDAATVVAALLIPGAHTLSVGAEHIAGARNLPLPSEPGAPEVCWRDAEELRCISDGAPVRCGEVVHLRAGDELPVAVAGALVVVEHPLGTPEALVAALRR